MPKIEYVTKISYWRTVQDFTEGKSIHFALIADRQ